MERELEKRKSKEQVGLRKIFGNKDIIATL